MKHPKNIKRVQLGIRLNERYSEALSSLTLGSSTSTLTSLRFGEGKESKTFTMKNDTSEIGSRVKGLTVTGVATVLLCDAIDKAIAGLMDIK